MDNTYIALKSFDFKDSFDNYINFFLCNLPDPNLSLNKDYKERTICVGRPKESTIVHNWFILMPNDSKNIIFRGFFIPTSLQSPRIKMAQGPTKRLLSWPSFKPQLNLEKNNVEPSVKISFKALHLNEIEKIHGNHFLKLP